MSIFAFLKEHIQSYVTEKRRKMAKNEPFWARQENSQHALNGCSNSNLTNHFNHSLAMRIIGQIDHPILKISVFKMENRISVKFENELYEQTFKLGDDDRLNSLEAVEKLVDAPMLEDVLAGFQRMHATRMGAMSRAFPMKEEELFEEII